MPDGFTPDQTAQQIAADFGVDIAEQLCAFSDHHAAKGTTFKDWQAAFRTWLRNANRFGQQRQSSRPARQTPNRQEALEARNRAVADGWVPPEMRQAQGARNAS